MTSKLKNSLLSKIAAGAVLLGSFAGCSTSNKNVSEVPNVSGTESRPDYTMFEVGTDVSSVSHNLRKGDYSLEGSLVDGEEGLGYSLGIGKMTKEHGLNVYVDMPSEAESEEFEETKQMSIGGQLYDVTIKGVGKVDVHANVYKGAEHTGIDSQLRKNLTNKEKYNISVGTGAYMFSVPNGNEFGVMADVEGIKNFKYFDIIANLGLRSNTDVFKNKDNFGAFLALSHTFGKKDNGYSGMVDLQHRVRRFNASELEIKAKEEPVIQEIIVTSTDSSSSSTTTSSDTTTTTTSSGQGPTTTTTQPTDNGDDTTTTTTNDGGTSVTTTTQPTVTTTTTQPTVTTTTTIPSSTTTTTQPSVGFGGGDTGGNSVGKFRYNY